MFGGCDIIPGSMGLKESFGVSLYSRVLMRPLVLRSCFRWTFLLASFRLGPTESFHRVSQKRKDVVRLQRSQVFLHTGFANRKESLKAACSAVVVSREAFLLHLVLEMVFLNKS